MHHEVQGLVGGASELGEEGKGGGGVRKGGERRGRGGRGGFVVSSG